MQVACVILGVNKWRVTVAHCQCYPSLPYTLSRATRALPSRLRPRRSSGVCLTRSVQLCRYVLSLAWRCVVNARWSRPCSKSFQVDQSRLEVPKSSGVDFVHHDYRYWFQWPQSIWRQVDLEIDFRQISSNLVKFRVLITKVDKSAQSNLETGPCRSD